MGLTIEYLPTASLTRYKRNARMHSEQQVDQLVESIQEFGFTNPVLIDAQGELIAGHGRLAAAEQMGMEEVPAIRLGNLSEDQVKALRIADNQLALNATWDLDLLTAELSELEDVDFSLDVLGFDDDFLRGLLDEQNDELDDGYDDDADPGADDEPADVSVVIGPYRVTVSRRQWDRWETRVRSEVGFDKNDIEKEIERRLGFE